MRSWDRVPQKSSALQLAGYTAAPKSVSAHTGNPCTSICSAPPATTPFSITYHYLASSSGLITNTVPLLECLTAPHQVAAGLPGLGRGR